jgi:microcystin-dependent protein
MATIVTRAGKGSPLTNAEVDANFNNLNSDKLETSSLVGQVAFFAMSTAPTGWLKANGAAVSRTAYADLFAAIGTTWGVGDGSTTFNVPDLRDRMPIGAENLYALGATGGSKDAIVVAHTHTITDPGHKHRLFGSADTTPDGGTGIATDDGFATALVDPGPVSTVTTGISVNSTGSSGTNANLPPYAAMVACIKF